MSKSLFSRLTMGLAGLAAAGTVLFAGAQTASAVNFFGDVCKGAAASSAVCSETGKDNISGNEGIVLRVAGVLALLSGAVAVFMIMLGGFHFMTAAGDSGKIASARNTIIYAVVGLVVIVLARGIIIFVVTRV